MRIGLGIGLNIKKGAGESIPAAPLNIIQPFLVGNGAVGEAVICNKGTWSGNPTPTYTYDFRLDSVSVQNGSSNSYTPLLADDGKTLTCLVTATNSQGSASEGTSNSIVIGVAPSNTIAPTLSPSGTQSTGTVITVGNGTFTGTAPLTYAYRWKRNGSIILGETANTYTLVAGDDGTVITAEVKASNAYGESAYIGTSNQVDAVNAIAPVNTARPVVSGTYVVGQTLSSTTGTWTGIPTPTFSYQWYRGATPIGTNSSSYTLVQADAGNTSNIKCVVTATNSAGSASADSNTVAQVLDATWNDFRTTLNITDATINSAMNQYTISRKLVSATASIAAYPYVGGTATTHSRNLYNPADSNTARRITWAGTVTHNSNGVQGNGSNGYGDTFINSLNDLPNNYTIILYSRTNQTRGEVDYGALSSNFSSGDEFVIRFTDNNTYYAIKGAELSAGNISPNTTGLYTIKRSGTQVTIKRNNVTIFNTTVALGSGTNANILICARNFGGAPQLYSSKNYSHFELLPFATTNQQDTDLYNAVLAKETALGRNV